MTFMTASFPVYFFTSANNKPINPHWYIIIIFDRRSNDTDIPQRYGEIARERLTRIYLDQIGETEQKSLGFGILKLVVEPPQTAGGLAQNLIARSKRELEDTVGRKQIRELIETIIIYKFPQLSYQEIETMLNLQEIKQTRVYQEAKEEGKLEGIKKGKLEGIKEGKLEGIKKGKLEGIKEGKLEGIKEGKLEGIKEGKLEGIKEGKLNQKIAMIPLLQELGLNVEQIADKLDLELKTVREYS